MADIGVVAVAGVPWDRVLTALVRHQKYARNERTTGLANELGHPCLSGTCFGCTDQAAGSSSLSASAAAAVACTLSGA